MPLAGRQAGGSGPARSLLETFKRRSEARAAHPGRQPPRQRVGRDVDHAQRRGVAPVGGQGAGQVVAGEDQVFQFGERPQPARQRPLEAVAHQGHDLRILERIQLGRDEAGELVGREVDRLQRRERAPHARVEREGAVQRQPRQRDCGHVAAVVARDAVPGAGLVAGAPGRQSPIFVDRGFQQQQRPRLSRARVGRRGWGRGEGAAVAAARAARRTRARWEGRGGGVSGDAEWAAAFWPGRPRARAARILPPARQRGLDRAVGAGRAGQCGRGQGVRARRARRAHAAPPRPPSTVSHHDHRVRPLTLLLLARKDGWEGVGGVGMRAAAAALALAVGPRGGASPRARCLNECAHPGRGRRRKRQRGGASAKVGGGVARQWGGERRAGPAARGKGPRRRPAMPPRVASKLAARGFSRAPSPNNPPRAPRWPPR